MVRQAVHDAIKGMKHLLDKSIFTAAGLVFPLDTRTTTIVKGMDRIMLVTERRDLMGPSPGSWGEYDEATPLDQTIYPWTRAVAAQRWLQRLETHIGKIDLPVPPNGEGWDWLNA